MKNKRIVVISAALLLGIACCLIYKYNNRSNGAAAAKIGVILPLSGSQALFGKDSLTAMKIAEEEINLNAEKGNGQAIRLIVEDGKYSSKDTIMAYNKLKEVGVSSIIVFGDVPAFTLAPYIEKDGMPCIAHVASGQNVVSLSSWMFRGWFSTSQIVNAMLAFMKKVGATEYSMLSINNNAGDEFVSYMLRDASANGMKCLGKDTFEIDSSDVRSQIKKVLGDDIRFVAVLGFGPGYVTAINQLSEVGYNGYILTDVCAAHRSYKNGFKDKRTRLYYTDCKIDATDGDGQKFITSYRTKTGEEPDLFSIYAYVNVKILSKVINEVGVSGTAMKNWLSSMKDFDSIIGPLSFDKDRNIVMPLELLQLTAE